MALQFMDFAAVQPQVETLQLTKNPTLNFQKTPDTSFSDLVASFRTVEERPASEEMPEKLNSKPVEESENKNQKVSENLQKTEDSESEEKVIAKDDEKPLDKKEESLTLKNEKEPAVQNKTNQNVKKLAKSLLKIQKFQKIYKLAALMSFCRTQMTLVSL